MKLQTQVPQSAPKPTPHVQQLFSIVPLLGRTLSYVKVKFNGELERRALIDTGAFANVISREFYKELINTNINSITEIEKPDLDKVKMANGNIVKIDKAIKVTFKLGTQTFTGDFLVLIVTTPVILGNPFFVKHKVSICPGQSYIKFPDQTLQILECKLYDKLESFADLCGVIIPNEIFEKDSEVILTSSLSKVAENNILYIYVLNITDHPITINKGEEIAKFSFLTSDQAEKLLEVDPQLINVAKMIENYLTEINQLIQVTDTPKRKFQPAKPAPEYEKLWFPKPDTCPDPTNLSPLQRDIYEQLLKLQEMEKLDPKGNHQDKITFLSKFPWEKSALNDEQKAVVGEILDEFSDIVAKHRFDVGYNTDLKIKLTPERSIPIYEQGPPTPVHLRNELQVELALMHYYGLITTLSQSRYSSPFFAQRKNSGRLDY